MKSFHWFLLAILAVSGCGGTAPATQSRSDENTPLSVTEYAAMVERGEAFLLDVRELDEISAGMAAPATWMPTSMIQREDEAWLKMIERFKKEPDKPVILYCRSGRRSGLAANGLSNLSISTYNLGGFQSWVDAGLPTKQPQDPVPGQ